MGFYFRKSLGVLGNILRLNFSKKGIGISTGVKGARLVFGPAGTYVHLGRNGFYYKKYLGKGSVSSNEWENQNLEYVPPENSGIPTSHITENFEGITDSESKEIVDEIQKKIKKIPIQRYFGIYAMWVAYPIILLVAITFYADLYKTSETPVYGNITTIINPIANLRDGATTVGSNVIHTAEQGDQFTFLDTVDVSWIKILKLPSDTLFVHMNLVNTKNVLLRTDTTKEYNPEAERKLYLLGGSAIFLIIWTIFLGFIDKKRKSINLIYEKDDLLAEIENQLQLSFRMFLKSKGKWQVIYSQKSQNFKYTSGAETLTSRQLLKGVFQHKVPIKNFKTNVKVPMIKLLKTELYFFPDIIILKQHNKIAGIQYDKLKTQSKQTRFIDTDNLFPDTEIIDYTYQYVNKNGDPDRRFANNRKLPICLYSEYEITTEEGLKAVIMTSKRGAMDSFIKVLEMLARIEASENTVEEILNQ